MVYLEHAIFGGEGGGVKLCRAHNIICYAHEILYSVHDMVFFQKKNKMRVLNTPQYKREITCSKRDIGLTFNPALRDNPVYNGVQVIMGHD